ncbi:MAG: hypothetical protein RLZZ308_294 [Candidatus Parcubacteria bacterium]|jgi:hypothetical protein
MKVNRTVIGVVILGIIILSFGSFYLGKQSSSVQDEVLLSEDETATTTVDEGKTVTTTQSTSSSSVTQKTKPVTTSTNLSSGNTSGFNTYASAEHGFSIKYPTYVKVRSIFSTFHEIGNNWRLYPSSANQGKSVVSFSIYSIDQGVYSTGKQTYPLYFTAEVRVGVSLNTAECYTPDAPFPNQKISNVTINGIAFKKFSTMESNTPRYTQAESYRTIRNNKCYAIEQIRSGTTYRDDLMKTGVAESTLLGYYATGETIVKTFRFTK